MARTPEEHFVAAEELVEILDDPHGEWSGPTCEAAFLHYRAAEVGWLRQSIIDAQAVAQ